jgi:multimeric flavodoxin WrbA
MSQVFGIMGSPRKKGNSHVLLEKILEGARTGGAGTELVLLGDIEIGECDGCHACWKGKECPRMDDMNDLYANIADSDVLIFVTPVYWYGPTALMKAFLDRFVYFNCPENRGKIKGKKCVLAVVFEEESGEAAGPLVDMFEKSFEYLEVDLVDTILVPGVTERGEVAQKQDVMDRAFELGKGLA